MESDAYAGRTAEELRRLLRLRDRQGSTSRAAWVRAAEAALTALPGASNSSHPGYRLWLRVEMDKQHPEDVTLSTAS